MPSNGMRASIGSETKAMNCKPNTSLKEKTELSNYSKPSPIAYMRLALVVHAPQNNL